MDSLNTITDRVSLLRQRWTAAAANTDLARLFAAWLVVFVLAGLAATFVASQYLQDGSFGSMVSYTSRDRPGRLWLQMYPQPFGIHYFGDFLDTLRHSQVDQPFATPGLSPVGYPLFSLLVIAPFDLVDYATAVRLFLLLTVLLLLVPLWRLLDGRTATDRLLLVTPLAASAPLLVTLDRGNLQGLVVGFALLGMCSFLRGNRVGAGFWFAISAAMKVYPVLLLLLLVRARDWRALGVGVLTGLTATWISFRVYGGGIFENSEALWDSVNRFRSESLDVLLLGNHSFKGGLATLVVSGPDWIDGIAQWSIDRYDTLLGLTALGAALLVVTPTTRLFNAVTYLMLLISFGVGVSFGYVPVFLFLVVALLYAGQAEQGRSAVVATVALALLLAPKGFPVGGHSIPLFTYLDPAAAAAIVLLLVPGDVRRLVEHLRRRVSDNSPAPVA